MAPSQGQSVPSPPLPVSLCSEVTGSRAKGPDRLGPSPSRTGVSKKLRRTFPSSPRFHARARGAGAFHQTATVFFFPPNGGHSWLAFSWICLFVCFEGVRRSFLDVSFLTSPFNSKINKIKCAILFGIWLAFLKLGGIWGGRKRREERE